ncbi:hypothetical protein A4X06_0g7039 [Tilletia controversa]|uniref:Uncharacterized protein n=1 Tax=Tilletia controversa TaxID=13291 RepID=A0A8X7MMX5_9BASI|nr:hypothetical protein A4X06_0g7039 [Tilletia controversa]
MWSMSRHGELTVRTGSDPPSRRARHGDFKPIQDTPNGPINSYLLHIPSDKTHARAGFDRVASAQPNNLPICPVTAVRWHLHVNSSVPKDAGAFAYRGKLGKLYELTSSHFGKTINDWLRKGGRPPSKDTPSASVVRLFSMPTASPSLTSNTLEDGNPMSPSSTSGTFISSTPS